MRAEKPAEASSSAVVRCGRAATVLPSGAITLVRSTSRRSASRTVSTGEARPATARSGSRRGSARVTVRPSVRTSTPARKRCRSRASRSSCARAAG